jgi:hypothetical protein
MGATRKVGNPLQDWMSHNPEESCENNEFQTPSVRALYSLDANVQTNK